MLAHKWALLAAKQDHVKAQYLVGRLYSRGEGVAKNYIEAAKWTKMAADKGHCSEGTKRCFLRTKNLNFWVPIMNWRLARRNFVGLWLYQAKSVPLIRF